MESLLSNEGLPVLDIHAVDWMQRIGWFEDGKLLAVAGVENCGGNALLRSVVTNHASRGRGLAKRLIESLHDMLIEQGKANVYLLTLDAAHYFEKKLGYSEMDRSAAPQTIRESSQFSAQCPDSAILMIKQFNR